METSLVSFVVTVKATQEQIILKFIWCFVSVRKLVALLQKLFQRPSYLAHLILPEQSGIE